MAMMPGLFLRFARPCLLSTHIKNPMRKSSTTASTKVLEHLKNRSLIKVVGTEALEFLQGLITNDMRHFDDGATNIYTVFLNIKGRVICDSIIYKTLEKAIYYIECDTAVINDLQKHLIMYRLRRKVDIESMANVMKVWSTFDTSAVTSNDDNYNSKTNTRNLEGLIFPCGTLSNKSSKLMDNVMIYEDPRIREVNLRILSNSDVAKEQIIKHLGFDVSTSNDLPNYREFLYRLGIGEGVRDFPPDKALPLEMNCDYLHGVSFHKGCYIGQELTARTHHTGVVRKRLMPLILENLSKTYEYDDKIMNEAGKAVGKFRGNKGIFGLGLMRIAEALSAQSLKIAGSKVTVAKPRWWPKEIQTDKFTADIRK